MLLTFAGCGTNEDPTPDDEVKSTQETESTPDDTKETVGGSDDSVFDGEVTEDAVRNYKVADEGDFSVYDVSDGVCVSAYNGDDTIVVIPETIGGKAVVAIESYLFANDSEVRGVFVPNRVKELEATFGNNKCLEVVICEGAEKILAYTFINCKNLHTVVLGESLNELGDCAFGGCDNLTELYIAPTLTAIDEEFSFMVFYSSEKLTIKGEAGSFIEGFCNEQGIAFEAVS